jgi:glucuronate isomerase
MKPFLDENFLLENKTAERLFHDFAAKMPIIDYHNHLPPEHIAYDTCFNNLTQAWLSDDHYKWRAMRANGIEEKYCTGNIPDSEKFIHWAATVPYTLRNPLYHWTHLELKRYFGNESLLGPDTAKEIYQECSLKLQSREFSVRNLLLKMQVKIICTTDDPTDNLHYHKMLQDDNFDIRVFPAFRPDKAMAVDHPDAFLAYLAKLEAATDMAIDNYEHFLQALKKRHDFFAEMGCTISDHGIEHLYAEDYTEKEISQIFMRIRTRHALNLEEKNKFKSAMLVNFAAWDYEKNWVQQYHLGALRNNNSRKWRELGPDTGWDSMGDFHQGQVLAKFLNRMDSRNELAKTILYNLNPADNAVLATMTGNFNDGSIPGKIQWGSAWWFLDQKDGMIQQLNALSNMGLLSRFIGMLTDSRSFLSFPRHEYFRRILCNLFGTDIEKGELPNDIAWTGKIIQDICYNNALRYFGFA